MNFQQKNTSDGNIPIDAVDAAIRQFAAGLPVILCDDGGREDEGDIAFPASACTPETVNFVLTHARGLLCISMTPQNAERLGVKRQVANGADPLATPFGS